MWWSGALTPIVENPHITSDSPKTLITKSPLLTGSLTSNILNQLIHILYAIYILYCILKVFQILQISKNFPIDLLEKIHI